MDQLEGTVNAQDDHVVRKRLISLENTHNRGETTIADVTRAAISKVVNASTLDELAEGIEARLTKECRRQLRQFGVYVHRTALTDFSTCRVYKVLGDKSPTPQIGV